MGARGAGADSRLVNVRSRHSLVLSALASALVVAGCAPDSGGGATVSEPGPLIEVAVQNHTSERARVELHSRSGDGSSGDVELRVDGCDGSWASSPLGAQWSITVNGAELIDDAEELPPAQPGESVVITVELHADGAQVSDISVKPSGGAPTDYGSLCG